VSSKSGMEGGEVNIQQKNSDIEMQAYAGSMRITETLQL